jgi:hypothetical protein
MTLALPNLRCSHEIEIWIVGNDAVDELWDKMSCYFVISEDGW